MSPNFKIGQTVDTTEWGSVTIMSKRSNNVYDMVRVHAGDRLFTVHTDTLADLTRSE